MDSPELVKEALSAGEQREALERRISIKPSKEGILISRLRSGTPTDGVLLNLVQTHHLIFLLQQAMHEHNAMMRGGSK